MRRWWLTLIVCLGLIGAGVEMRGDEATSPVRPPAPPKDVPAGELGEMVKLGQELVLHTDVHPLTRPYVGNALRCSSCHLDGGMNPRAATFIGVATAYPAWSPRERQVITLEDRVAHCFLRSMNGKQLPPRSRASVAIAAYITWLSQGQTLRMNDREPLGPYHVRKLAIDPTRVDGERGRTLYAARCADCHGADGHGTDDGPPVWGPRSFNSGAGLAQVPHLANWLKVAMPLDDANLTDADALDIAAYIDMHDRPQLIEPEKSE